jgi:hypothetical protein
MYFSVLSVKINKEREEKRREEKSLTLLPIRAFDSK